jgi:hypothetical protein
MHFISSLVGVPRIWKNPKKLKKQEIKKRSSLNIRKWNNKVHRYITLMISTSWSTALSPGNRGCTNILSKKYNQLKQ